MFALHLEDGTKKWTYSIDAAIRSSPAVYDGMVYIGAENHRVYALDAHTGAKVWQSPEHEGKIRNTLAVDNGLVFFGCECDRVYARRAGGGGLAWEVATLGKTQSSAPVVEDGVVFIGSDDGTMYALRAENGDVVWTTNPSESDPSMGCVEFGYLEASRCYGSNSNCNCHGFLGSPTVKNGVVYVGGGERMFAFDAATGAMLWNYQTNVGDEDFVFSKPIIWDSEHSMFFAAGVLQSLYKVDTASGNDYAGWDPLKARASKGIASRLPTRSSPAEEGGSIFFTSDYDYYSNSLLSKFDGSTDASAEWQKEIEDHAGNPTVWNGVVYVAAGDRFYAFDATTGDSLWGDSGKKPAGLTKATQSKDYRWVLTHPTVAVVG